MDDDENIMPILECIKNLSDEFNTLKRIPINSENFTLGRGLKNSAVIPFISISRHHCLFKKIENNRWVMEDNSSFGIRINNQQLGKGASRLLAHEDVITLEPSEEFVYKFIHPSSDVFEIPRKRMKKERNEDCVLKDMRIKFEESQNYEIKHIEEKINNAKQLQNTSIIMQQQLQQDMDRKIKQLKKDFALQIENLEGEKNEVEKQKALLIEERNVQLAQVKNEMEGKIAELKEQINKHNETESELLKENNSLKEKLMKEREEFLSELSRETSSKQDLLDKLEEKIREQEEVRQKEKQELENMLKMETEQLRLAKEKELKELEEQKRQREQELEQELNDIKKNLTEQVQQTEMQRRKAEEQLNIQMEQMKNLSNEDKIKMEQLLQEREEIQNKLKEAQNNAEESLQNLQKRVQNRETELAALAAERIQVQADQSSVVITNLQQQLEQVKHQLQSVETEKNTLLESIFSADDVGEGTSKQHTLTEVGELMENELQCGICAELFIEAMTLSCSHTFCKYCINMWKKKKKDCPICRSPITSECRSLVLDSFIEKMVQNLTEEMKTKRQDLLKFRAAEVSSMTAPRTTTVTATARMGSTRGNTSRRRRRATTHTTSYVGTGVTTPTSQPIPTVDLTMVPIPINPSERPPILPRQVTVLRPPLQPTHLRHQVYPAQRVYIQGTGQAVMLVGGGVVGASPASRAPTTAATDGASVAARADTGRPAARSGNNEPVIPNLD